MSASCGRQFLRKLWRGLLVLALRGHPEIALDALRKPIWDEQYSFAAIPEYPQHNFEDITWMLASNPTNKALLIMELDEAAFLFRLVRSIPSAQIMEIGRGRGGSTFLFAVAGDSGSTVTSVDIEPRNEDLLRAALEKSGLAHKVHLLTGNSHEAPAREDHYELVFIDGDHSREAVRRDYEHWKRAVRPGGHLTLHNAAVGRPLAQAAGGAIWVADKVAAEDKDYYRRLPDVGSLAVFSRTTKPWPRVSD